MIPSVETDKKSVAPEKFRAVKTVRLIRWAVRFASVPIFGLLLISLIPALASFGISPRDDRIIAIGLAGAAIGFAAGWRWPGIGGIITLISVAAIVSQEDNSLSSDPFSVAFALQGILFLISWVVNPSENRPADSTPPRILWLKKVAAALLVVAAGAGAILICRGPSPVPLPKGKEAFVGVWDSGNGLRLEITDEGRAKAIEDKDAKVDSCNSPVAPGTTADFLAEFHDDRLELLSGVLGPSKVYHLDRSPFTQGKQTKMVLNGSLPYKRASGMVMVKKQPGESHNPVKGDKPVKS